MIAWFAAALASPPVTLDAEAVVGLRLGGAVSVDVQPWRGLILGARGWAVTDAYFAVPNLGAFDVAYNLRVAVLPSVGWRWSPGPRDRFDLDLAFAAGPEVLFVDETASFPGRDVSARYRTVDLSVPVVARIAARGWVAPRWALEGSCTLASTLHPERIHLGLGLSHRWGGAISSGAVTPTRAPPRGPPARRPRRTAPR